MNKNKIFSTASIIFIVLWIISLIKPQAHWSFSVYDTYVIVTLRWLTLWCTYLLVLLLIIGLIFRHFKRKRDS